MVFKELEIQGFKSFPDKVKITFDEGVTGVVGPNGSGKSNLSDAVRWVLGETSARQLRAAGKMEDVIFGGTRRRGAMGFAQVRLTLDNSAHTLDLDADEAVIGRKYYRSGESEYSINGQVCRLKDVYELLLDTGIGRDGYSVIGQGRIAEIVAAKSTERREIFEEACGIAKYRYRKNEAERRLAAAAENLERLRDILGELEARVGPLEKESAKAQKFLALRDERKTLEVTLWTDGVHRAKEAVRRQVRDYETAEADYERFDRAAKAAESEAEEIRMQAQQLTIAVERLNGDIRSITEQISGSESRIAVLENDIARNEESAAGLRAEIAAGQQDSTEAEAALERHRAVAASMEAAGQKLAEELAALTYRSKKEIAGQVRIVTIPGADVCACCGTHTAATGQVGQIKILTSENYKGGVRLSVVCGGRALREAQAMRSRQADIGALLSAKADQTAVAVHRVYDEYTALKFAHFGLCSQLFDALASQLGPDETAIRTVPGLDPDGLHRLAARLSEATTGLCAALTPSEKGTGYCIAQAGGDVRALTKALNAALNGRGGGKPGICQGSCAATPEQVEEFLKKNL